MANGLRGVAIITRKATTTARVGVLTSLRLRASNRAHHGPSPFHLSPVVTSASAITALSRALRPTARALSPSSKAQGGGSDDERARTQVTHPTSPHSICPAGAHYVGANSAGPPSSTNGAIAKDAATAPSAKRATPTP